MRHESCYDDFRYMKKILAKISKVFRSGKSEKAISTRDLRRGAEKFAKQLGPAIKQLSKE